MRGAGRRGDPHECGYCGAGQNPAQTGVSSVLVNNRPVLIVGDEGTAKNGQWVAMQGSSSVLIKNKPVHRVGDTEHCSHGSGNLAAGSRNVLIGDTGGPTPAQPNELHVALFDPDGQYIPNVDYVVDGPVTLSGKTGTESVIYRNLPAGNYTLRFPSLQRVVYKR